MVYTEARLDGDKSRDPFRELPAAENENHFAGGSAV
jgi:hypothetical protein